jgi:hypothetical protein
MSINIEKLPDEPIVIEKFDRDFNFKTQARESIESVLKTLDQQSEPVFYIIDAAEASISLDDIIASASLATKQFSLFKHPNIRETLLVTQSQFTALAARGLNSPLFGHVHVLVFKTLQDALSHVREVTKAG